MLILETAKEHFEKTCEFAFKNNCLDKLMGRLRYLKEYDEGKCHVQLWPASYGRHSFDFQMYHTDWTPWFNGGLVLHDYGEEPTWGVHT